MKKYITLAFILLGLCSFSQGKKAHDYDIIVKKEVSFFIDTVRTYFTANSFKYIVFVSSFNNEQNNSFCFTLGYILNSASFDAIDANYYFTIKNQIVVVRIDPHKDINIVKKLKLNKINNDFKNKILLKLFPSQDGGFTYKGQGLTYCEKNKEHERTFFQNEDEIPLNKSIYNKFPIGIEFKKIEEN